MNSENRPRRIPAQLGRTRALDINTKGGFVTLSDRRADGTTRFFCSGTLYANTHFITAKHCLNSSSVAYLQGNPGAMTVWLGRGHANQQTRLGKRIWFPGSTLDYALVEVSSAFNMPRNSDNVLSTSGYSRQFSSIATDTPAVCFSSGRNAETCDSSGNNCTGSGEGTLRWATLTASIFNAGDHNMYRYRPNVAAQLQAHGDSGGGCVTPTRSLISMWKQPIVSVNSTCFPGSFCNAEPAILALFDTWRQVSP